MGKNSNLNKAGKQHREAPFRRPMILGLKIGSHSQLTGAFARVVTVGLDLPFPIRPREVGGPLKLHLARGLVFLPVGFAAALCRSAINSSWSVKALDTRPAAMSASAFARRASTRRR